jgi:nucleotide-binding universal stress UspA family protein
VPVDGTPQAEAALEEAAALARAEGARLRLLWTSPAPPELEARGRVIAFRDQEEARVAMEASAYLRCLADRLPDLVVDRVVRLGPPAEQIVAEAQAASVDMIAMAAREPGADPGWSGLADAVTGATTIPVIHVPCGKA